MSQPSIANTDAPRERLAFSGAATLSNKELIAILLGTGRSGEPVLQLAERIARLAHCHGGLASMGFGHLASLRGVGPTKACRLLAAVELGRRLQSTPLTQGKPLRSSVEVHKAFAHLASQAQEHFIAVALDARQRVRGQYVLAQGGIDQCTLKPADTFRRLLAEQAAGAVFVHNHPSGHPRPSQADIAITQRLVAAGNLLGIAVVDHVIVAKEGYFSFLDAGLLTGSDAAMPP